MSVTKNNETDWVRRKEFFIGFMDGYVVLELCSPESMKLASDSCRTTKAHFSVCWVPLKTAGLVWNSLFYRWGKCHSKLVFFKVTQLESESMVEDQDSGPQLTDHSYMTALSSITWCRFFKIFFFLFVVNFVIHWNETAMGLHVFPIPIPPPTSLSTRSL